MKDLFKRAIAEAIGTFVLVFCACGVAMGTNGDVVPTALAFGLVIVAMAYTIGRISGCHINPAVSLGCFLTKRMTLKEFGVYVAAQVVGGLVGGLLIFTIYRIGYRDAFGFLGNACNQSVGFSVVGRSFGGVIGALLTEVVLTCIFVYVILNVTDEKSEATKKSAGIIIGLTLTLVHLIGIGLTGTSVNPARSIATAFSAAIFSKGGAEAWKDLWIFIVGPMGGAAVAAILYNFLHTEKVAKKAAKAAPKAKKTAPKAEETKAEEIKAD